MNLVTDLKDKLAEQAQTIAGYKPILTGLKTSLDNVQGDIKTLNGKITSTPPAEDGSVTISKDDWADIQSLVESSSAALTDVTTQLTAVDAEAKAIDEETPTAEVVTDPVLDQPPLVTGQPIQAGN